MLLTAILVLPLVGAAAAAMMPREDEQTCRHLALVFSLITFGVSLGLAGFQPSVEGMQFEVSIPWIRSLGINFHLGIDGISLWLVLMTTFLTPIVVLSTYKSITAGVKEMMVALLVLETAMLGAFVALDLFLFYVFWEIMLVPMYLMIGVWGHGNKTYAALKFVIYTALGSLLMLVAIIYIYLTHGRATGDYTFDYTVLMQSVWGTGAQIWLFAAFALAFAIKVPLFPLHTWLPDAHTQAPTAGSVVLAAVLLKMGTYGFLRFAIPMFPWAAAALAPYLAVLAVIGIIYGAMVAYAQSDAKRLIAYSSVSHLGFVMLGMLAMNATGIQGSIYQMINHAVSTGALFLIIGVLYDRRHTHELNQFGGLWKQMPVFAGLFMIVMLASAGLPGLNGFVGEFMILVGAFTHSLVAGGERLVLLCVPGGGGTAWLGPRAVTAIAAGGVVLGAVYLLHLFQKLMFGPITQPANSRLADLNRKEIASFLPLIALIFIMGIYPKPFLKPMEASVRLYLKEYGIKYAASERHTGQGPQRLSELSYRNPNPKASAAVAFPSEAEPRPTSASTTGDAKKGGEDGASDERIARGGGAG